MSKSTPFAALSGRRFASDDSGLTRPQAAEVDATRAAAAAAAGSKRAFDGFSDVAAFMGLPAGHGKSEASGTAKTKENVMAQYREISKLYTRTVDSAPAMRLCQRAYDIAIR